MGSRSPATAGFFDCTLSRFPWSARNIPDGTIHTLGTICTLNFASNSARRAATVSASTPTVTSTQFGGADRWQ